MTISELQKYQQAELHAKLWSMANTLRGTMEPIDFKNYILGLIFYRYLSENLEVCAKQLLEEDGVSFAEAWANEEYQDALKEELIEQIGYYLEPQYLFSVLLQAVEAGTFEIEQLLQAINHLTESTLGHQSQADFDHLFDDMDLTANKLGRTVKERSTLIGKIMVDIADIPFTHEDSEIDILGDAYEYLISQFAATAGKKAGEFYTPQAVSKILSKLVTIGKTDLKNVYDPTCGSGSLLLRVGRESNVRNFYGQELSSTTYNLARMNMLLHGVNYANFDIKNGNTLEEPMHVGQKFEAIVANPPYSADWSADARFLEDERFNAVGKLAPKSKADFAFVQHMIHHLDDNGTMAVVLPHGVLFRGAAEGLIRKYLIEERNVLDAVIGLPANIFFGTQIATIILVFKKCREHNDNIFFIDASNEFEKGKNQNYLSEEHVDKIVGTYKKREVIEKYSSVISLDEIRENDYNLNIPRYVDTFEEEELVDLNQVTDELITLNNQIDQKTSQLNTFLVELGLRGL